MRVVELHECMRGGEGSECKGGEGSECKGGEGSECKGGEGSECKGEGPREWREMERRDGWEGNSLRNVGSSAFFVGRMVMRRE